MNPEIEKRFNKEAGNKEHPDNFREVAPGLQSPETEASDERKASDFDPNEIVRRVKPLEFNQSGSETKHHQEIPNHSMPEKIDHEHAANEINKLIADAGGKIEPSDEIDFLGNIIDANNRDQLDKAA